MAVKNYGWIKLSFQRILNTTKSSEITLNTGTPRGCPISPNYYLFLALIVKQYILEILLLNFQMTLQWQALSLTTTETINRREIDNIEEWCKNNYLFLYVKKTKELIIDFRRKQNPKITNFISPYSASPIHFGPKYNLSCILIYSICSIGELSDYNDNISSGENNTSELYSDGETVFCVFHSLIAFINLIVYQVIFI